MHALSNGLTPRLPEGVAEMTAVTSKPHSIIVNMPRSHDCRGASSGIHAIAANGHEQDGHFASAYAAS